MAKFIFSDFRKIFLFRDPRGPVIIWGLLLAAVWYATYALHLWRPRPEEQGLSFLSGSPARGGRLFSSLGCNVCHAIYGIGPKIGPDLGTSLPAGSSPVRIVAEMWNHSPGMWQKMRVVRRGLPLVTEQDALDLLSYLYVVRYLNAPGDANTGQQLFVSKGCARCHTLDGSSRGPSPDLGHLDAETPIIWAQRMWNHGKGMETLMLENNIPWPTFRDQEMLDLLAFLQNKSSGMRQVAEFLPATPSAGRSLFIEKGCSSCHSVSGEGDHGELALWPLQETPPSLAQFAGLMWNHSPELLAQMEKKEMPRPQFAEREMADLIAFLYLVQYLEPVGRVDMGIEVFHEMHCSNCHGADGRGGREGPSLARPQHFFASQFAYTIWSHGPQMYQRMREKNIPWPALNENELLNLVAFLNSL